MKIIVDSREQLPYEFAGSRYSDVTIERGTLPTGDYSLAGLEDRIAIERKSLSDLTGTLTKGRQRFEKELERSRSLTYFGLVIECSLDDIRFHRYESHMNPHSLLQSLTAYTIRYGVHINFCGSREGSEYVTFSILQKFLYEQQKHLREILKAHSDEGVA